MNSYLTSFPTGFTYNGIKYTTQYISGGTFSLDGIHPTQRGYALLANKIITTINEHYGSTMPQTDANKYHGINFP
jgi:lysophospholipase L1-like esterase